MPETPQTPPTSDGTPIEPAAQEAGNEQVPGETPPEAPSPEAAPPVVQPQYTQEEIEAGAAMLELARTDQNVMAAVNGVLTGGQQQPVGQQPAPSYAPPQQQAPPPEADLEPTPQSFMPQGIAYNETDARTNQFSESYKAKEQYGREVVSWQVRQQMKTYQNDMNAAQQKERDKITMQNAIGHVVSSNKLDNDGARGFVTEVARIRNGYYSEADLLNRLYQGDPKVFEQRVNLEAAKLFEQYKSGSVTPPVGSTVTAPGAGTPQSPTQPAGTETAEDRVANAGKR